MFSYEPDPIFSSPVAQLREKRCRQPAGRKIETIFPGRTSGKIPKKRKQI
jgi:hypothetical protein